MSETMKELRARLSLAEATLARFLAQEDRRAVMSPCQAELAVRKHVCISSLEQETMFAILLTARKKILKIVTVAVGTISNVDVHPRDIFREACRMSAHSIIIAHNHPSGEKEPSDADIALTERICQAGDLIGIPLLDHIILTATDCCSILETHGDIVWKYR